MLRDSAMERFLTTPLEEREKLEQMKNLSTRLSSNEAIIAKLEKELNDVIAERDAEVSSRVFLFFSFSFFSIKSSHLSHIQLLLTICQLMIISFLLIVIVIQTYICIYIIEEYSYMTFIVIIRNCLSIDF